MIYIPLWLDLLYKIGKEGDPVSLDLHSTMVRFIIIFNFFTNIAKSEFTFHYG